MTDRYLTTVYNVVSYVTQIPVAELRPHSRFSELLHSQEEFHDVYEQCAEALDVPLARILDSMPVYRVKVGDVTMNSWRNLAPFSRRAHALLLKHDVRMEDETLESLAQSMAGGAYVSSGKYWPYENPPRSKGYVIGWALGLPAAALGACYGLTFAPCNPLCSDCTLSTWAQIRETAPYFLGIALFLDVIAIVPGLIGMRVHKNKRPSYGEAQAEMGQR